MNCLKGLKIHPLMILEVGETIHVGLAIGTNFRKLVDELGEDTLTYALSHAGFGDIDRPEESNYVFITILNWIGEKMPLVSDPFYWMRLGKPSEIFPVHYWLSEEKGFNKLDDGKNVFIIKRRLVKRRDEEGHVINFNEPYISERITYDEYVTRPRSF